jgi:hypothetical protein
VKYTAVNVLDEFNLKMHAQVGLKLSERKQIYVVNSNGILKWGLRQWAENLKNFVTYGEMS